MPDDNSTNSNTWVSSTSTTYVPTRTPSEQEASWADAIRTVHGVVSVAGPEEMEDEPMSLDEESNAIDRAMHPDGELDGLVGPPDSVEAKRATRFRDAVELDRARRIVGEARAALADAKNLLAVLRDKFDRQEKEDIDRRLSAIEESMDEFQGG